MFYFYDEESTLSFDDVIGLVSSGSVFARLNSADVPVGNGNHWVILPLEIKDGDPLKKWILEINFPNIDYVEAAVKYDGGNIERFVVGDDIAFSHWPIDYRKPAIPLSYLASQRATAFFKIKSETPLIFPLHFTTEGEQEKVLQKEHFLYGAFYGAIFILALYNAGVYFSLRDKSYHFYILYILSFSMVQASTTGLGQQYLWPGHDNATTRVALLAVILTNFFMVNFVIHFLDLARHRPSLIKPMRLIAGTSILLIPTLFLDRYAYTQLAIHFLNVVAMISMVIAVFSVVHSNRRPAVYLMASYSVLFSAIIFTTLFQTNLVQHYAYIDYILSFAILVEAIILSIGLSERIAQLRIENERSERERRIVQEKLSQQLIQTRERERAEISKLLHDSVNHDLVVVQKKIERLSNMNIGEGLAIIEETKVIDEALSKTIDEIRNISHLSHPQVVEHLGLESALKALLGNTFDSSITWDLYIEDVPLDYDSQLFLYRAVQESTTNIIKHANASECLVRLQSDPKGNLVHFILKDDGDGFDASRSNWGFGLKTLNEHCKSVAGSLKIRSFAMKGTVMTILLPIKP